MKTVILIAVVVILVSGVVFLVTRQQVFVPQAESLKSAPDLIFKDYEGREINLSDWRGRNVIINSWASWCPFCKEELLDFANMQKELGDKVVIIALDRAESLEIAKKYSDGLGIADKLIFLLDPKDSFYQFIGGFSMPETVFIDKEGFIRYHRRGPMKREEIKRRIEQVFAI